MPGLAVGRDQPLGRCDEQRAAAAGWIDQPFVGPDDRPTCGVADAIQYIFDDRPGRVVLAFLLALLAAEIGAVDGAHDVRVDASKVEAVEPVECADQALAVEGVPVEEVAAGEEMRVDVLRVFVGHGEEPVIRIAVGERQIPIDRLLPEDDASVRHEAVLVREDALVFADAQQQQPDDHNIGGLERELGPALVLREATEHCLLHQRGPGSVVVADIARVLVFAPEQRDALVPAERRCGVGLHGLGYVDMHLLEGQPRSGEAGPVGILARAGGVDDVQDSGIQAIGTKVGTRVLLGGEEDSRHTIPVIRG